MELNNLSKKELIDLIEIMSREGYSPDEAMKLLLTEDFKRMVYLVHTLFCKEQCTWSAEETMTLTWERGQHVKWTEFAQYLLQRCDCDIDTLTYALRRVLELSSEDYGTLFAIQNTIASYLEIIGKPGTPSDNPPG